MKALCRLIGVDLLQMLHALQVTRGGRKRFGATGALALLILLALYLSGLYGNLLGKMLVEVGLGGLYIPMMAIIALPFSLVLTLPAASGVLFGGRDTDLQLTLPVGIFTVTLSKMGALYLENMLFAASWMIPVGVLAHRYGILSGGGWVFRSIPVVLALPLVSSLLAGFGGYGVALVGSRAKHKALMQNLAGILLFALFFLGGTGINDLPVLLLERRQEVQRLFATWLLPFGLMGRGMEGSWGALSAALLLCALPFLAFICLFSMGYRRILSGLRARTLGKDYRIGRMEVRGVGTALLKKEVGRLLTAPAYLMNCCIGAALMVGSAIWRAADRKGMEMLVGAMGRERIAPLLLVCMALLVATIYPTAVSVSLEGKTLWILKEAPVAPRTLFAAKACLNLVAVLPAVSVSTAVLVLSGCVSLGEGLGMFLVCLSLGILLSLGELAINLRFPSLEAGNDMRVVKNSPSALISVFGSLLFVGVLVPLWIAIGRWLSFAGCCLGMTILLAGLAALIWRYLQMRGAELWRML